jgi:hypothetical protein
MWSEGLPPEVQPRAIKERVWKDGSQRGIVPYFPGESIYSQGFTDERYGTRVELHEIAILIPVVNPIET